MYRRPNTVIMVAFATGSTTIQSNLSAAEVRAAMKGDETGEVTLKSISETKVKEDPRSDKIQYVLKDEEVMFQRNLVVFWSVAVAHDPPEEPLIKEVKRPSLVVP